MADSLQAPAGLQAQPRWAHLLKYDLFHEALQASSAANPVSLFHGSLLLVAVESYNVLAQLLVPLHL